MVIKTQVLLYGVDVFTRVVKRLEQTGILSKRLIMELHI